MVESGIEARDVDAVKGRGVVTSREFAKGEFVTTYQVLKLWRERKSIQRMTASAHIYSSLNTSLLNCGMLITRVKRIYVHVIVS